MRITLDLDRVQRTALARALGSREKHVKRALERQLLDIIQEATEDYLVDQRGGPTEPR